MKFILQRRVQTDGNRWRTVVRFAPFDQDKITEAVKLLSSVDKVLWRVVFDDREQKVAARWSFPRSEWEPT